MARTGGSLGLQNVGVAGSSAQPQQPLLMGMSQRVQGSHSTTVPVNASQQAGLILQSSTSLPVSFKIIKIAKNNIKLFFNELQVVTKTKIIYLNINFEKGISHSKRKTKLFF